ncbi:MAG: hypothetical protein ACRD2G_18680, partial [Terriglobia bacterium]
DGEESRRLQPPKAMRKRRQLPVTRSQTVKAVKVHASSKRVRHCVLDCRLRLVMGSFSMNYDAQPIARHAGLSDRNLKWVILNHRDATIGFSIPAIDKIPWPAL